MSISVPAPMQRTDKTY